MNPYFPSDLLRLSVGTITMMAQAQSVIAMRMMGMAGLWAVAPTENARMVQEKIRAGMRAGFAMQSAALSGKSPTEIAEAALTPISRTTAANVRRLSRKGPKLPF